MTMHTATCPPRIEAAPRARAAVAVTEEELARLRRLIQLATTTIGELNLWLATAGHGIDGGDR
jgi:hypothetical protein